MEKELKFDEFEKTDFEVWKRQAESTLKGASFDKKLISRTIENIDIQPLYQSECTDSDKTGLNEFPGYAPFNRSVSAEAYKIKPWLISQELISGTPAEFNRKLKLAIKDGLESVNIKINIPDSSLNIKTQEDLEACFEDIDITGIRLNINAGQDFEMILQLIKAHCEKINIPTNEVKASILIDPVRDLSLDGSLPDKLEHIIQNISKTISDYSKVFPGIKLIGVDSTIFHNAGASAVQELAISIAIGTEYFRHFVKLGHEPADISNHLHFSTSVSSNFFMEIAKIKAHRVLWNAITHEFGISSDNNGSFIEAQNSLMNKSMLDKHSNILRSTGETMASILGGANIITSFQFDNLDEGGSDFGDRIARNIQHVLRHEAHLLDTIDPAGGTWFIDNLVNEISQSSWALFREIESRGGIVQSLRTGYIQEMLSSTLAARVSSYHSRKETLLGVNIFANSLESINWEIGQVNDEKMQDEINKAEIIQPVHQYRFAQEFEDFRRSVYEKSVSIGTLNVFIANFGKASEYAARMDFSSDFFRIGGFSVNNGNQFEINNDGIARAMNSFSQSGSRAMVICSSDNNYPLFVDELANEFKKQNPDSMLILAGYPAEYLEQFRISGVNDFIHIKSDILEQLRKVFNKYC